MNAQPNLANIRPGETIADAHETQNNHDTKAISAANAELLHGLFQKHAPTILRRARRILGNDEDAQEAVQEVFLRAMRHADTLCTGEEVVGWFYRVTTNYCLNQFRNTKRRRELFEQYLTPQQTHRDEDPAELLTMRWLLANADKRQAVCAAYVYLDDLQYDEVATLMGVSKRTVSNLLDRFKAWSRAHLEPSSYALCA